MAHDDAPDSDAGQPRVLLRGRPVDVLTSTRNPRVRAAAGLAERRHRSATGLYLVEGQHPVAEALADGVVDHVFTTPERLADVVAMVDAAVARPTPPPSSATGRSDRPRPDAATVDIFVVADHVLARVADAHSPQGIVAVARQRWVAVDDVMAHPGVVVLLVDANDPGNVGAIVRTADAAGARGVILTDGSCDPHTPKAVRAAAGSTTHLALGRTHDSVEVVVAARARGRRTLALDAGGTLDLLAAGPAPGGDLLVMGSEAHGLSHEVLAAVDEVAFVPIRGRAESLNLSVATALALYAVTG